MSWTNVTIAGGTANNYSNAVSSNGQIMVQCDGSVLIYAYAIIYTTNYGTTWDTIGVNVPSPSYAFVSMVIAMSSNGNYVTIFVQYIDETFTSGGSSYGRKIYVSTTGPAALFSSSSVYDSVNTITCIAMSSDGSLQVAVDADGQYYVTTGYWATGTVTITTPGFGTTTFNCIAMSSTGQYQTVGSVSSIFVSNTSGATFTNIYTTSSPIYGVAMSYSGQYQTVVTGSANYYYSTNYGSSWNSSSISGTVLRSVCINYTGQYQFITGINGDIYESTDYGVTFTAASTYGTSELYSCAISTGNNSSSIVMISDGGQAAYATFDTTSSSSSVVCFLEDTKILCQVGGFELYLPVQSLRKGTLVKTLRNGFVPVHIIAKKSIHNPGTDERIKNRLYRCSKDSYPELKEDLFITGCHSILVDTLTEKERIEIIDKFKKIYVTDGKYRLMACVDKKAQAWQQEGEHMIWHFALENNDYYMNYGVYANGLLVESASKRYITELSEMEVVN